MAEGDAVLYNSFKRDLLTGVFNLSSNTIRTVLVTGYVPNIDTHATYADISASEVSGAGYTAGGAAITSPTVTLDTTNDRSVFDGADVTFTALNVGTPSHAVLQRQGASATTTTNQLIGHWELGRASNGGDYTLSWNAIGILTLT